MQRLMFARAGLIFGLASFHGGALAQDDTTKVLLENEQVRVVEMRFKPGAKIESLSHRNRFVYALTDGALVFKPPGGRTAYELSFKAGEALWLPAQSSETENDTDKEVRAVVVDLKEMPSRAKPVARGKTPKAAAADTGAPKPTAKTPAKRPKSGS